MLLKLLFKMLVTLFLLVMPVLSYASAQQAWDEAMLLAKQGSDRQAIALMRGANMQQDSQSLWAQRFDIATRLLELRTEAKYHSEYSAFKLSGNNQHEMLMANWLKQNPLPETAGETLPGLLAAIIPGSGHAWMGRWGDAGVAAMLVWPLLILTFWAARREMGPVTVFFALITAWLWSGTVFSAVSLAERGNFELYYAWWQEMWIASGLPSRPW